MRRIVIAGHMAMIIGIGIGRFAYTPMVPILIAAGLTPAATAYLGAANFVGYMAGALLAARLSSRWGAVRLVRGCMIAGVAALAASALTLEPAPLALFRFVAGVSGGVLMVAGSTLALSRLAPGRRPLAGGLIYAGVGVGTAVSSVLVGPAALIAGVRGAWGILTLLAMIALAAGWRGWSVQGEDPDLSSMPAGSVAAASLATSAALRPAAVATMALIVAAYACDGAGFTPHSLFWVDFVARELGLGMGEGSVGWLLFGAGAAVGPVVIGFMAQRLGTAATLILAFAVKATAIALALIPPSYPLSAVARALSPFLVGGLSPGFAAIVSVRLTEFTGGSAVQARVWGLATFFFALMQAAGGFAFARAFQLLGSYRPLFAAGAALELAGLVLVCASVRIARTRVVR